MSILKIILSLFKNKVKRLFITQKEYGKKWPFTVSEGYLECRNYKEVVFNYKEKIYAINGKARMNKKYYSLDDIWLDDPNYPNYSGIKIAIGSTDIIQRGLTL